MTLLDNLLAALRRNRNRGAALRQLRRMPLHQLADIGIAPSQIEEAVDGLLSLALHGDDPRSRTPLIGGSDRRAGGIIRTGARVPLPAGLPR